MGEYGDLLIWAVVLSTVMFVASPLLLALVLIRLPADYLTNNGQRRRSPFGWQHPLAVGLVIGLKNMLGVALALAGIVMLFTPGQGLLALAIGIALMDFPGKRRLERRVLARRRVLQAINRIRAKAGRAPLAAPMPDDKPAARSSVPAG